MSMMAMAAALAGVAGIASVAGEPDPFRERAPNPKAVRLPDDVSARQRKKAEKLARRAAKAKGQTP